MYALDCTFLLTHIPWNGLIFRMCNLGGTPFSHGSIGMYLFFTRIHRIAITFHVYTLLRFRYDTLDHYRSLIEDDGNVAYK